MIHAPFPDRIFTPPACPCGFRLRVRFQVQAILDGFSLNRPDNVEDVLQEICIECLWGRHRFRGACRFDTWLRKVAEYTAIDFARQHLHRQEIAESQWAEGVFEKLLAATARTREATLLQQAALHDWLEGILERLPPRQRQVICLRYWDGLSCQEIAERLGLKPQTVRATLHFGLRACRRMIAPSETRADVPQKAGCVPGDINKSPGRNDYCL